MNTKGLSIIFTKLLLTGILPAQSEPERRQRFAGYGNQSDGGTGNENVSRDRQRLGPLGGNSAPAVEAQRDTAPLPECPCKAEEGEEEDPFMCCGREQCFLFNEECEEMIRRAAERMKMFFCATFDDPYDQRECRLNKEAETKERIKDECGRIWEQCREADGRKDVNWLQRQWKKRQEFGNMSENFRPPSNVLLRSNTQEAPQGNPIDVPIRPNQ